MPKPGDFFLGLYEFFSILVPGALLLLLLTVAVPEDWGLDLSTAQSWAGFLLLAYLAGHLLQLPADIIDAWVYDRLYVEGSKRPKLPEGTDARSVDDETLRRSAFLCHRVDRLAGCLRRERSEAADERRKKRLNNWAEEVREAHQLRAYARDIVEHADPSAGRNPPAGASRRVRADAGSIHSWAYATVKISSDEAIAEIDRLQADSKLFRSLVVVCFVTMIAYVVFVFEDPVFFIRTSIFFIVLILFSLYRYAYLRWKATEWLYQYFILFAEARPASDDKTGFWRPPSTPSTRQRKPEVRP